MTKKERKGKEKSSVFLRNFASHLNFYINNKMVNIINRTTTNATNNFQMYLNHDL